MRDGYTEKSLWQSPLPKSAYVVDDPGFPPRKGPDTKPWTGTPAFCPALEGIDLPGAQWHRLASVPAFTVCNKCYSTTIRDGLTQFFSSFSTAFQQMSPSEVPSRPLCYFSTPHVRRLWSDVQRVRSLDGLIAYARMRTSLPQCAGPQGCTPASPLAPPTWYTLSPFRLPQVEGFVICATCYHDEVAGSPAEACFHPHSGSQGPSETWSCDASVPRVRWLLRELASTNVTWQRGEAFSNGAKQRLLECPPCPGVGVRVDSRSYTWFKAKGEPKYSDNFAEMAICGACVLDFISSAPAAGIPGVTEDMFERRAPVPKSEPDSDANRCTCDAAVPSFRFALTQDYNHPPPRMPGVCAIWGPGVDNTAPADIWRDAARRLSMPGGSCAEQPGNAIPEFAQSYRIRWAGFASPVLDFDLCAACYMGIARPLGFHDKFVQTAARNKICDLGHAQPRRDEVQRALIGACAMRDFGIFERWVLENMGADTTGVGNGTSVTFGTSGLVVPRIEDFKT
ncbi:unnamed protein product [Peniophora sp. CBMAI 1063]|nr:unnamed protein product [Peniophora sp. CBMAI 1063]